MNTLSFKLALSPNQEQARALASHVGASRFAFNWALAEALSNWKEVEGNPAVPYISLTAYSLRNRLNLVKEQVAPWWRENSKEAFASGTANASKALINWFKFRKNHGRSFGFPNFKSRHHDSQTGVTFTTGSLRLELDNRYFTLPRIGKVKLHEKAKTLRWLISQGGRITQATVKNQQNRWFIAINVKVENNLALRYFNGKKKNKPVNSSVGLDVGLKVFLTNSDGEIVENPQHLRASLTKLRKANKRLARRKRLDKKTGEAASNRWNKAHLQVVKAHAKIANQRKDFLHKTSKQLVDTYEIIGLENLNIKGMVKNRHLSLSIADAGWGEFKRQLKYKSDRYGSTIIEVDRFYPSSKTCSSCGAVKAKLSLSERTYKCENCSLIMDRDLNAALNIKTVAYSWWETLNERGEKSSGLPFLVNETILAETLRDNKSQVIKD